MSVIYPGVRGDKFTPLAGSRAAVPTFSYIGRLKRYKGVDIVMRAFARLGHPEAVLEIAGAGDFRPRLEALAHALDLGGRVRFLGFVTEAEKLALLRRSWSVALASPKEGWGLTNVEAAACGTPVVASNSPGIRESVMDGVTGFLAPHGDVDALAAAIDDLETASTLKGRVEADIRFHELLAAAAGNPVFTVLLKTLGGLLVESRRRTIQAVGPEPALVGHRDILAAVTRHDPAAAEAAMRRHLD